MSAPGRRRIHRAAAAPPCCYSKDQLAALSRELAEANARASVLQSLRGTDATKVADEHLAELKGARAEAELHETERDQARDERDLLWEELEDVGDKLADALKECERLRAVAA